MFWTLVFHKGLMTQIIINHLCPMSDVVSPLCLMCWQPAGDSGRYTGRCGARSPVSTKYRIMYELATSDGIGCRAVNAALRNFIVSGEELF